MSPPFRIALRCPHKVIGALCVPDELTTKLPAEVPAASMIVSPGCALASAACRPAADETGTSFEVPHSWLVDSLWAVTDALAGAFPAAGLFAPESPEGVLVGAQLGADAFPGPELGAREVHPANSLDSSPAPSTPAASSVTLAALVLGRLSPVTTSFPWAMEGSHRSAVHCR